MALIRPRERASDYLTREEALAILGVKAQTLYAYVSRGHIRSVTQPDGRSSFYVRDDVEKMRAKSAARAGHGAVAASAMRWGEPVIVTSITDIAPNGPHYRGR
ncbi:MAG: citrate synthase, partial [Burkholderiales bacterium]